MTEVDDPGRSLSRTHARFGVGASGFWVEDHRSAEGTFAEGADGSTVQIAAEVRHLVPAGGAICLGERTFTVRPAR